MITGGGRSAGLAGRATYVGADCASNRVPTTGDMRGTTLMVSYGRRYDFSLFSVVCGKEAGMKLRLFCCTAPANRRLVSSLSPGCFSSLSWMSKTTQLGGRASSRGQAFRRILGNQGSRGRSLSLDRSHLWAKAENRKQKAEIAASLRNDNYSFPLATIIICQ